VSNAQTLVAFGDPSYGRHERAPLIAMRGGEPQEDPPCPDEIADPVVRSAAERGVGFAPLPSSRDEVEAIASLYAPNAVAWLGSDATEERAKAVGRHARIVHFACHAIVNERFPLDSALVLSLPEHGVEGRDNGLLEAWEIFEHVRLDADLVTLSACESGLGKEAGGEGLLGLTRAFQYAGARSILASLWKVEDEASFELMTRFYSFLREGKTKDQALRAAELEMIHGKPTASGRDLSDPRHWVAFERIGDWK